MVLKVKGGQHSQDKEQLRTVDEEQEIPQLALSTTGSFHINVHFVVS
jgi:hypothetical protein